MAYVDKFCIDKWEVHLIDSTGKPLDYDKHPPYNLQGFSAASKADQYPNGFMSQNMARAACNASGKRLCTIEEWEKTCRGKENNEYPYGKDFVQEKCNVGFNYTIENNIVILPKRPHILDFLNPPPENSSETAYKAHHSKRTGSLFNDPLAANTQKYLAKTGSFEGCAVEWNGELVFDIVGNLSEWTGSKKDGKPIFGGDGHSGTARITLRNGDVIRAGCSRSPAAHDSEYHDYSLGTRCCKN